MRRSISCRIWAIGTARKAVSQMWTTVHARYSSMRYEAQIIVAENDKVAANIRVFFSKRHNNRIVRFDIAAFYTLRDGRIARTRPSTRCSRCSNATSSRQAGRKKHLCNAKLSVVF